MPRTSEIPCVCGPTLTSHEIGAIGPWVAGLALALLVCAGVVAGYRGWRAAALVASTGSVVALMASMLAWIGDVDGGRWWWSGWGSPWETAIPAVLFTYGAVGAVAVAAVVAMSIVERRRGDPDEAGHIAPAGSRSDDRERP